jgi:hypothetical protein
MRQLNSKFHFISFTSKNNSGNFSGTFSHFFATAIKIEETFLRLERNFSLIQNTLRNRFFNTTSYIAVNRQKRAVGSENE